MELKKKFEQAVLDSGTLARRPDNESLLQLYALYKQATEGDVTGERPAGFDFKAIAKYDAWAEKKSLPTEHAMRAYVDLVQQLQEKLG